MFLNKSWNFTPLPLLREFSLWPLSNFVIGFAELFCKMLKIEIIWGTTEKFDQKIFIILFLCLASKDDIIKLWCRYFYLLKCKVRLSLISDIFSILWNWKMANFRQCLDSLKWEQRLNKLVNKLTTPKLAWMLPKRDANRMPIFSFG